MKPSTIAWLACGTVLAAGAALLLHATRYGRPTPAVASDDAAVRATAESGPQEVGQFLEITAKGGYTPRLALAKAGVPLVLKIKTDGTFDCSATLRMPELGWTKDLDPTGEVSIPVPAEPAGVTITGVCSMGMYSFKIAFE